MRWIRGLLIVGVASLLAGCSLSAVADPRGDDLVGVMVSDVDPESRPAFLDDPQEPDDILPAEALALGLEPSSSRYQGELAGQHFYLATDGGSAVRLVSTAPGVPDGWGAGGSTGNVAFGSGLFVDDGRTTLVYLPQGSADPPEGWKAFSDWIIVPS